MCRACHQHTDIDSITDDHKDEILACIRGLFDQNGKFLYNYCVDCGERVEGTDHNCYD